MTAGNRKFELTDYKVSSFFLETRFFLLQEDNYKKTKQ